MDACGKRIDDLPRVPTRGVRVCWAYILGECQFGKCRFRKGHVAKQYVPDQWAQDVCTIIKPGVDYVVRNKDGGSPLKKLKADTGAGIPSGGGA